jgi:DNA repair ATPase RecN
MTPAGVDRDKARRLIATAICGWHSRKAIVCEHTQIVSYSEAADAVLDAFDAHPVFEIRPYYPTEHAYDAACKALQKHRQRAEQAERERDIIARQRNRLASERDQANAAIERVRHHTSRLRSWYHDPNATVAQAGAILRDLEAALSSASAPDAVNEQNEESSPEASS